MFCDRLLAAGGVVLLLTGCGAKGPPKPPLSREPQPVRDLYVRQAGSAIELRWSRPRARANGDSIQGRLTFRVLARNLEREPVTSPNAAPVGAPPAAPGVATPGGTTADTTAAPSGAASATAGTPATVAPPSPPAPGSGGPNPAAAAAAAARASEESFLRDAVLVAEIEETPEQAAAAKDAKDAKSAKDTKDAASKDKTGAKEPAQYSVLLGPERFPQTRFTSVRLAFAVVAQDSSGRRSHARPVLEIDPVEALPPPSDLRASGTPEGIALAWRLPAPAPSAAGPTAPAAPVGVDIYRAQSAPAAVSDSAPATPQAAPQAAPASALAPAPVPAPVPAPRFTYKPIAGSPFTGESAVDRTVAIGTSYLYEARLVSLAPGRGLRESVSSGTVALVFSDVFAPGAPTLVTALPGAEGAPSVRVAWSSPIDADVAGYRVYRAEGEGAFVLAATLPAGQIEWTDTDVKRSVRYRYNVATIDAAVPPNESVRSEEAEITLPKEGS